MRKKRRKSFSFKNRASHRSEGEEEDEDLFAKLEEKDLLLHTIVRKKKKQKDKVVLAELSVNLGGLDQSRSAHLPRVSSIPLLLFLLSVNSLQGSWRQLTGNNKN